MKYEMVVGLEIHAELKTSSKVFCACGAEFGGQENSKICAYCLGMPGPLPTLNKRAVELAVRAGLALGCTIHRYSAFDRKNYFYPDLPKAYQITQYFHPICTGGRVDLDGFSVGIERVHIEEDAGKLLHDDQNRQSLIDYNRCGVPLIEIVTKPDIRSARQAVEFVRQVALRLKYADVCDAKMEQGSLRCDVNISVCPQGSGSFGTRTEIKNLNSLKSIGRAIEYEFARQVKQLKAGRRIVRQTLHFDQNSGATKPLRTKDNENDYRYFPEPDLPPIMLTDADIESVKDQMPEMPHRRVKRYVEGFGLNADDAELIVREKSISDLYDAAVLLHPNYKAVANILLVDLLYRMNEAKISAEELNMPPINLANLAKMVDDGVISRAAVKDIIKIMLINNEDAETVAKKYGFIMQSNTDEIYKAIDEVLAANPKALEDYKRGKNQAFGFFMGQLCRKMGNSANPQVIRECLNKKLKYL